jgi:flagellar hook-length control protein FliK
LDLKPVGRQKLITDPSAPTAASGASGFAALLSRLGQPAAKNAELSTASTGLRAKGGTSTPAARLPRVGLLNQVPAGDTRKLGENGASKNKGVSAAQLNNGPATQQVVLAENASLPTPLGADGLATSAEHAGVEVAVAANLPKVSESRDLHSATGASASDPAAAQPEGTALLRQSRKTEGDRLPDVRAHAAPQAAGPEREAAGADLPILLSTAAAAGVARPTARDGTAVEQKRSAAESSVEAKKVGVEPTVMPTIVAMAALPAFTTPARGALTRVGDDTARSPGRASDPKVQVESAVAAKSTPSRRTVDDAGVEVGVSAAGTFDFHLKAAGVEQKDVTATQTRYEVLPSVGEQGWSNAISKTVVSMLKDGLTQAKVSINPENLGPIDIKITMDKGSVGVDFFSPYQDVREALTSGVDQLQARFAEAGVTLDRVASHDTLPTFNEDLAKQDQGQQGRGDGRQDQRRDPRRPETWFREIFEAEGDS